MNHRLLFSLARIWLGANSRTPYLLATGLLTAPLLARGQNASPTPLITLQVRQQPLPAVLRAVEQQCAFTFVYNAGQLDHQPPLTLSLQRVSLETALLRILVSSGLTYRLVGQQIILFQGTGAKAAMAPPPRSAPAPAERLVRGRITARDSGLPLPGATVLVKGSTRGTSASATGDYQLAVLSTDSVLLVSSLGFLSQEVALSGAAATDVSLPAGSRSLQEVVVTGYGLERERIGLGYAVQELSGAQLVEAREPNFLNAASGKLAGVQITRSGSGPMGSTNLIIRGYTSLTRDSRPLIVVDGVPIDNRNPLQATRLGGYDSGDGLTTINPEDVESLSVLKGANAGALYGNRAANGVLIVTTKKGQPGLHLSFSSNTTFDRAQLLTDYQNEYGQGTQGQFLTDAAGRALLTPEGYPQLEESLDTGGSWGPRMEGQLVRHGNGQVKPFVPQPDNPQEFFQLGYTTANTVALSTGGIRSRLRVSLTDLRNQGTYPNSRLGRDYLTLRGSTFLTSRLSAEAKISYVSSRNTNRPTLGAHPDNVMVQFQHLPRSFDLDDLRSYRNPVTLQPVLWNQEQGSGLRPTIRQNPFWAAYLNTNSSRQDRANGFVSLRYDFAEWLWLQLRAGTDRYRTRVGYRYASYTAWNGTALPDRGGVAESELTMREDNYDVLLTSTRPLGRQWSLTAQAFGSLLQKRNETTGATGQGLLEPNVFTLANAASQTPVYAFSRFEVQSVFGRTLLGYRDAVFLELTGRNDWDSTLPRGNWSYFYPSASLAVAYTKLLGWKAAWLSEGKLRASWARVGKGAAPYELATQYDLGSGVPNGPGVGSAHLGQPFATLQDQLALLRLKPQLTRAMELGSEMHFGADRATLDVTVYRTNTFNQVTSVPVSTTSGFRTQLINAGNIRNQGLEVVASGTPVRTGRWRWNLTLNWAANRSLVQQLNETSTVYQLGTESNNALVVAQVGQPFGNIYGTRLQRAPDGQLVVGTDGLPVAPATTPVLLGNFQPTWFGGLQNQISYRNFSLGVLLDARWGGQIYSVSQQQATQFGNTRATVAGRAGWYASEEAREAAGVSAAEWVPTGGLLVEGVVRNPDGTYSPSRRYVNPQAYWARLSTVTEPFVYSATFIKLREVTLTYHLPPELRRRWSWLHGASIAVVGRNLAFLKRNTVGFDPESAYNLSRAQGLESGGYPNSQTLGYHLTLDF